MISFRAYTKSKIRIQKLEFPPIVFSKHGNVRATRSESDELILKLKNGFSVVKVIRNNRLVVAGKTRIFCTYLAILAVGSKIIQNEYFWIIERRLRF